MPRTDDYKTALALAVAELKPLNCKRLENRTGAQHFVEAAQEGLILPYFGQARRITWPESGDETADVRHAGDATGIRRAGNGADAVEELKNDPEPDDDDRGHLNHLLSRQDFHSPLGEEQDVRAEVGDRVGEEAGRDERPLQDERVAAAELNEEEERTFNAIRTYVTSGAVL